MYKILPMQDKKALAPDDTSIFSMAAMTFFRSAALMPCELNRPTKTTLPTETDSIRNINDSATNAVEQMMTCWSSSSKSYQELLMSF